MRLTGPVSTFTARPGDPVHAILTRDVLCDGGTLLPQGTPVEGFVFARRKVGWGIRHETAALDLQFTRALLPAAAPGEPPIPVELPARVEEVENARERVRHGVVQGIRSSDTFQGNINSRLIHLPALNPYSDPVLIIFKAAFPVFPEPEIFLPAGTDLHLRTTAPLWIAPSALVPPGPAAPVTALPSPELTSLVAALPSRVRTSREAPADLINLVFLAPEPTLRAAFHHAGWDTADPVSRHSVTRNFFALLNNSGYPREPMMTFFVDGRPEDMNWQKSLNSYSRRDHLRLWRWPAPGEHLQTQPPAETLWISSSTHDTTAVLNLKYRGFLHHIAPDIDQERSTVIRDLNVAGCVASVTYVPRPTLPRSTHNATGDLVTTDGSVAVVALQPCQAPAPVLAAPVFAADVPPPVSAGVQSSNYHAGNRFFRLARRGILTVRSDIWRANILYGAYELGDYTVAALRPHRAESGHTVPAEPPILAAPAAPETQPPAPAVGGGAAFAP